MRLLLATMSHETNTLSPVPSKVERFCRDGKTLLSGQAAINFYRGTATCLGGFLAVAEEVGAEIVVPLAASAPPSGRVDREAFEVFCGAMRGEVRPVSAWGSAPMLPHVMAQGTHQFPNKDLQAMCAGVGVCTSDYGQLTFKGVRRPIFPLDPLLGWNARV